MAIVHIVLVKFKDSLDAATVWEICNRFLDLKTKCINAQSQQPYILNITGGANSSKEGLSDGLTHGFSVIFASENDRDYYVEHDAEHASFAKELSSAAEKVTVVDYEPQAF